MGFTSPPPPPDKLAPVLWQISIFLKTWTMPDTSAFEALPPEEQRAWLDLATQGVRLFLAASV